MTPTRGSRETLAAATALQRARAAALQKDSEAAFVATQPTSERGHFSERAARRATDFQFQSNPPVFVLVYVYFCFGFKLGHLSRP